MKMPITAWLPQGVCCVLAAILLAASAQAPGVPGMSEVVPTYERAGPFGLLAPAKTPRAVLHQVSKEVRRVLELPGIKDKLQAMGFAGAGTTPEEFEKIVRSDIDTFVRMAKVAGLRAK